MVKWKEELKSELTPSYHLYQDALSSQLRMGLRVKIPECVDFYEGRQWPPATENTKNLPRPVVNVVKMICRSKKGAILSTPVKIHYKSYSPYTDIERFNAFATSVFREIGQDELDRLAIDDAIKKGSYFFHYFWDKESISRESGEVGALSCELIDPLNIFFANPAETNEQKQDWIMISSRIKTEKIKNMADPDADTTLLMPDGDENDNKTTLLTRYFRVGNDIFCERQTKFCIISKPFNIIPAPFDKKSKAQGGKRKERILYPIVCGQYERRENSIYGMGEVEGLIPNQKAINFNIAMSLLNAQQCAWGKYVALPNALNGQKISNVPGQVLVDFSGTGEGIKRLPEAELSRAPMELTTALEELTRSVSGASSVMTGEISGTSLSGAAIAYLQSQAQVPIEELKSSFWFAKRKQGMVVAQFLKHFYLKHAYIKINPDKGCDGVFDEFSSRDFESSLFEVYVEAIGGTKASLASDISLLDSCLKAGKISLETYIRAYPASAITNKEEILKQIKLEKDSEVEILRRELKELKEKHAEF